MRFVPQRLHHAGGPTVDLILTHLPILETRRLHWPDEAACARFAAEWAGRAALHQANIVLEGELGAGKTTLVRHLLRALGVEGRIKSPTYAVVEPYTVQRPGSPALSISHFDFYRFSDPREWEDAGFRDLFAQPGLKLSEWPERVAAVLPPPDLQVQLTVLDDDSREVTLNAFSPLGQELLA